MAIHWCGTGLSAIPGLRRLIKKGYETVVWNRTIAKAKKALGDITDNIHAFDKDAIEKKIEAWGHNCFNVTWRLACPSS